MKLWGMMNWPWSQTRQLLWLQEVLLNCKVLVEKEKNITEIKAGPLSKTIGPGLSHKSSFISMAQVLEGFQNSTRGVNNYLGKHGVWRL